MAKKKKQQIKIEKRKDHLILVFLMFCIIGFIIYSNIFSSPFVLDDRETITENRDLRYNEVFASFNMMRYIGYVTFALNYKIDGVNTFGYHIVNILIHIINAALVYILFRMILSRFEETNEYRYSRYVPLFIALVFLVHPIQTQSVTYTVQRFTSLAALFALLAIILYLKFRMTSASLYRYYVLSLIAALLAYKTKENTATIPIMMILIEIFLFRQSPISLKKRVLLLIPFIILIAVIPISFMNLGKPAGQLLSEFKEASAETSTVSRSEYLITEFSVIVTYMRLMLLPFNQCIHYNYAWAKSFFEPRTFLSFCFLAILFAAAIIALKKYKEISLFLFWFFVFLLVESSLIPIQDALFEHRLYLPAAGFIGAIVLILDRLLKRSNPKVFIASMVAIAIIFSILTYRRNEVWKDEITFWKDVIYKVPQNPFAHASLGTAYSDRNMVDPAIKELQEALRIKPDFMKAHGNLGYAYYQKGWIDQAINEYKTAIKLAPDYTKGYYTLAVLYFKNGKLNEAFDLLQQAHEIDKTHPMVNCQMGIIYCVREKFDNALASFSAAIKIDPENAEINYNYAVCLLRLNRVQEARMRFFKALEYNYSVPKVYYFIASTYDKDNDVQNAISYYQRFLSQSLPDSPFAMRAKERLQILSK